ncbi:hypothetical protein A8F94_10455 [Bacillus sp. FJAT-27225]|nr:hypothetical protein A8F94_10455 [Bacillus sp. FJAT-27225]
MQFQIPESLKPFGAGDPLVIWGESFLKVGQLMRPNPAANLVSVTGKEDEACRTDSNMSASLFLVACGHFFILYCGKRQKANLFLKQIH